MWGGREGNGEIKNYAQVSSQVDTFGESEYRRWNRFMGDDQLNIIHVQCGETQGETIDLKNLDIYFEN